MKQNVRPMIALLILVSALAAGVVAQKTDSAQALLRAASDKATVDGDLNAAIKQYQAIVEKFKTDRAAVATALVQMAECYQKLGDAEARQIYERVVREYADQKEAVAVARTRLGGNATQNAGIVTRQVWTGPEVNVFGSISPDGRLLSFLDSETGNIALRNLATSENRRLQNKFSWPEWAFVSRISPDGRLIAYNWMNKDLGWETRVGPVDGSSYQVLFSTDVNSEYCQPEAWSPDGKQLVVALAKEVNQIALISVAGGPPRVLKSFDWRSPGHMVFSPDGKYIAYDFPPLENSPDRDIYLLAADGSREVHLVEHAADDHVLGWLPDGRILFASDRTGATDAWTLAVREGKVQGAPELLKKNLGIVTPLGLTRAGSFFYGVKVDGPDVYTVSLDSQTGMVAGAPSRVAQRFVGTNSTPAWSPDGRRLAYFSDRSSTVLRNGVHVLGIADLESGLQRELPVQFDYTSESPSWSSDGRSLLVRAPDEKGRLSLFLTDAETGRATVLVRHPGLVRARWSPDGKTIFVLTDEPPDDVNKAGRVRRIVARDLKTGVEKELFRETATTMVGDGLLNHLAVSKDGRLLAFTLFGNGSRRVMILPSEGGESREIWRGDLRELAWMPDGSEIVGVKRSSTDPQDLWAVPVEGGEPRPLGLSMKGGIRWPAISPDGRRIAFASGRDAQEVWALESLQRQVR